MLIRRKQSMKNGGGEFWRKRARRADDKLNDRERFYITTIAFIFEISTGKFIDIIQSSLSQQKLFCFIRAQFLLKVERPKDAGPSVHRRDAQPTPKQGV